MRTNEQNADVLGMKTRRVILYGNIQLKESRKLKYFSGFYFVIANMHRFWDLENDLEGCMSCQSFADWQEAVTVYWPAGKEESKVVIKSAYEVKGMR